MQQWFEMISVQVGQKRLWLWMTATHVFMWEWLEDELLFNSVLIGKGVIALCFFPLLFFCKPAIAYRCCCRVRMDDRLWFFRGLGKKTNKAHSVCLKFTPLTTSPSLSLLGELVKKYPPHLPSLVLSAALLCLYYSLLYCRPACVSMHVYRLEDN